VWLPHRRARRRATADRYKGFWAFKGLHNNIVQKQDSI
jgi:hypothetical protein